MTALLRDDLHMRAACTLTRKDAASNIRDERRLTWHCAACACMHYAYDNTDSTTLPRRTLPSHSADASHHVMVMSTTPEQLFEE